MKTTRRAILRVMQLLLAAASITACAGQPRGEATGEPAIALEPCQLAAPGTTGSVEARCGTLTVFEDRAARVGRTLDLKIAVIPATSRSPAPDPLFFLAGGPGQAATESYPLLASALERINQTRDIVLVDQRGTGGSHPLRCPASEGVETTSAQQLADWIEQCLAQLDADPRLYTTAIAMDDLDDARAALGYATINLYGVSYGTRAALTYMRQHPDRVRSAILDGVVPLDEALGADVARDAQRALDLILARCDGAASCQRAFPNAGADFAALLERVEREPARLTLAHPITGAPAELTFDRDLLATGVRLLSYAPETAALLPLLFHSARTSGDLRLLAAQTLMVGDQLAQSISAGLNLSVLCAEDEAFFAEEQQAAGATYLGTSETDHIRAACSLWPHADVPAEFKQPVESSAPTLLLSGEADPVTPPENAERAAETLPNSLQLVAPGQGHNVLPRGCLPRIAADFVERAAIEGLDTACVADIQPMPFFASFTGPLP
jgi:pimeloyl-ACP methyl ester carboxylesterase